MQIPKFFISEGLRERLSFYTKRTAVVLFSASITLLVGCASPPNQNELPPKLSAKNDIPDAIPKAEQLSRYGNPNSYVVAGNRYHVLKSTASYEKTGMASWYGTKFHGRLTSSREPYDMHSMTAASPTLPIPSYVHVTNLSNGRSVIVKVNDRGPFKSNRIIDLSYAAAKKLDYLNHGTAKVKVTAIDTRDEKTMLASRQKHEDSIKAYVGKTSDMPAIQLAENSVAIPKPEKMASQKIMLKSAKTTQLAKNTVTVKMPEPEKIMPEKTVAQNAEKMQLAQDVVRSTYLQVGAFKAKDRAINLSKEVSTLTNVAASVKTSETSGGKEPIYLVNLGPIDEKMSTKLQAVLAQNGFEKPFEVGG
ncbi:MAG: rare lipoprotein [Gammaproteobacteria bacterium]|jgi:rare lipoprotein A (peptidoglycan hydrolase)|nr:rare lipoprotein [Gammaproteobacteria bacterium]